MATKVITQKYLFYFTFFVNALALMLIAFIFKQATERFQIVPMIIAGIFFIGTLAINFWCLNRQVHLQIQNDNSLLYETLFKKEIIPLKEVQALRQVWVQTYLIKLEGRLYTFYGLRVDVDYLRNALANVKLSG